MHHLTHIGFSLFALTARRSAMPELIERIAIDAPSESVWEALNELGGLTGWAPHVVSFRLLAKKQDGGHIKRTLSLTWDRFLSQTATPSHNGRPLRSDLKAALARTHSLQEIWSVVPAPQGSVVTATVRTRSRSGILGRLLHWLLVHRRLRALLARRLTSLTHWFDDGVMIL
jgi:hypothetical protein